MFEKKRKKENRDVNRKGRKFFISCLVVVCFLLFAGVGMASATNYYVATDGSDSNLGTSLDHPWQHPSYAAQRAQAGDTIYLLDGTWYNERITFANSGTETKPIVMKAYDGTPTLYCTKPETNKDLGITIKNKAYITIDGITLRHYWEHIFVRQSEHIHILNCAVYTEKTAEDPNQEGITMRDGVHESTIENCLVEGDAWNSIGVYGRVWYGGKWNFDISSHITVSGCTICKNSKHTLIDLSGIVNNVYITDNTLYDGWSGTIYSHQGFASQIYIKNNNIYDSSNGMYFDSGIGDSVIENNRIYGISPKNGHSIHIRAGNTYGATSFQSANNIIRNNYCRGDVYCEMISVAGKNNILDHNDVHSDFGDIEYRMDGRDNRVRNAIGGTYRGKSTSSTIVDYTDGRRFSVDGKGEYSSYTWSSGTRRIAIINEQPIGTISGTVTDTTGTPITGATVQADSYADTSSSAGSYTLTLPEGKYTVIASKAGYYSASQFNVVVTQGATTTVDFVLSLDVEEDTIPPYTQSHSPAKGVTSASRDASIVVQIKDDCSGVAVASIIMTVEGTQVTPTITGTADEYTLTYTPPTPFDYGQILDVTLDAQDLASPSNVMPQEGYSFAIESAPDYVGYWTFDEGSGNTAHDSSGNNNDGTIQGASWTEGKQGKGLSFDGTNDYVDCGRDSSLEITGAITVEAWVKWTDDGDQYFVTKIGGPKRRSCDLSGNADGTVEFRVAGADCNTLKSSGSAPIPTGEWVYLVGTYEPSKYLRLFVNGALATESTTSIPAAQGDNGLPWYIGAREGNQGWFNGVIDKVKIYNGALSAEEIRENYEANPSNNPPTAIIESITQDPAEQGKETISFSGHGTDTDGTVVAYNWRSSINGQLSTTSSFGKSASELSVGTHTIYFKVQDDEGAWSTEVSKDLTINHEPENIMPVADPKGPYTGTEGIPMDCDGSNSYDTDGSVVAYEWDFGDGNIATGVAPTHTYAQNGSYTVTLTVTDNDGAIDTNTTTATIAETEPTVDFSATPTSGQEALTVSFTDNSTSYDGIVGWNWDFDNDGETDSTVQNPTHKYAEGGVYTVSLSVTESDGDNDTLTKVEYITVIKVNEPPVADPNGPYMGTEGVPIAYDGSDSYDPDGSIAAYEWAFGDGNTATGVAPTHAYAQDGTYTVTLTVTDNDGAANTNTTTATIADTEPTADFSATPTSGQEPLTLEFTDNSTSYDGILEWNWDFDNDGETDSTEQNPTHVYAEDGVYTVSLSVTESDGDCDTMTKADYITVTAVNQIEYIWLEAEDVDILTPDFETVSDISASNGKYIQIPEGVGFRAHDGEATYRITIDSPGDYIVWGSKIAATGGDNSFFVQMDDGTKYLWAIALSDNWQWDAVNHWGSGGEYNPEIDPLVFTLSAGEHTLKIIQREDGAKLDELLITNDMSYVPVSNNPPTAIIDSITPDIAEQGKETVAFSGHGTDTDGSVVAYNWRSSRDGQISTASSFSKPASELSVGTHTIYFKVQDDKGAWSTEVTKDLTLIEPANQAPVADPSGPYTGTEGFPIDYDGSGSYETDGSIVAYGWDFGDGDTATGVAPTHTYAQNGTYTVALTVTDNDGATGTYTTTATIADSEPSADFSASPTCGDGPLTVTFTDSSASYDGIVEWAWDFDNDDVTDSTAQNPTYEYAEGGGYTVSLIVTESDGDSDTMTKADYITVADVNNAPYAPDTPSPSDGATEVPMDEALSWTGDDPDDGDTVTYDVYFGSSMSPPLVAESQLGTTYDPGTFDHSTEYYWQIVAKDNHGAWTGSEVWSFVTATSPEPDLVAEWDLDEGSGLTAVDSSGNGNDGTLINNPTRVNGKVGKGLSFDGTNDYVDCGQDPSLKITGAITVEAWVNWQGDGNPYIVTKTGGPSHRSYDLSGNTDGTVEFRVGGANGNTIKSSGTTPIPSGEWVYLVGTYEPSNYVRLFVNGALAAEDTTSIPASQGENGLPWYIGAREGNQGWFNGIIDEIKIHNGALSAEEIRANYEAYPSNRPPVADPKGPYTSTEGVAIVYDGSGSYDLEGSIVDYEWDFGDGNTATDVTPTHTYAQDGEYTVTLTVTDNDGATGTYTTTATIADSEPTVDFSASSIKGRGPLTVEFTDNSASYNGIEAWEWDFDNDGETDSTEQNPSYLYTRPGVYTVSLTVYESDGGRETMTKEDYIEVIKMNMKVKVNP